VSESREVLVVGAGPAGCASAILLKERGHDVLLIDAARFPRDKVCGEGVSPEAWRLLRAVGADERVRARSPHPLRGMRLTSPDGTSFVGEYGDDREPGFALRRIDLDLALLETARAKGVAVAEDTRATELHALDGVVCGVSMSAGGGPETRCTTRLVVAADGRGSLVARRLGLLHAHRSLRKFAVRGHFEGVQGLSDYGEMHVGRGAYCGVAPLSASRRCASSGVSGCSWSSAVSVIDVNLPLLLLGLLLGLLPGHHRTTPEPSPNAGEAFGIYDHGVELSTNFLGGGPIVIRPTPAAVGATGLAISRAT
jgi:2-polyprenyl-6-methoxyphenol hydroxylase-like FAD-dependent oxidoreductase